MARRRAERLEAAVAGVRSKGQASPPDDVSATSSCVAATAAPGRGMSRRGRNDPSPASVDRLLDPGDRGERHRGMATEH